MKLAGIFNAAAVLVAANVSPADITKIMQEGDLRPYGFAHAYQRQQVFKCIQDKLDHRLRFFLCKVNLENSNFQLHISGAPNSIDAAENSLKTWADSLIVLEREALFSRQKLEYLKSAQLNNNFNKDSRLVIHLLERQSSIVISISTMPDGEEEARRILDHLITDYCEEAIKFEPEKLGELEEGIRQKRQELWRDNIVVYIDKRKFTFYVTGTNPQFAMWVPVIKSLAEKKSNTQQSTLAKNQQAELSDGED